MSIDFEKDQQDAMKKTGNIQSLADQVEKLEDLQKRLELQVFQSSLLLTAHMFDEIDQVST